MDFSFITIAADSTANNATTFGRYIYIRFYVKDLFYTYTLFYFYYNSIKNDMKYLRKTMILTVGPVD